MHSARTVHEGVIISVRRLPSKAVVSVRSAKNSGGDNLGNLSQSP